MKNTTNRGKSRLINLKDYNFVGKLAGISANKKVSVLVSSLLEPTIVDSRLNCYHVVQHTELCWAGSGRVHSSFSSQ